MPRKRILVVDDMAIFREPISATLTAQGYKTVCAENGKEAYDAVAAAVQPFDLILLDMTMPEMDGITFLKKMRQNPAWALLPVVMLTEVSEKDAVVHASQLGISQYVLKSTLSLDELLKTVKAITSVPKCSVST